MLHGDRSLEEKTIFVAIHGVFNLLNRESMTVVSESVEDDTHIFDNGCLQYSNFENRQEIIAQYKKRKTSPF